MFCYGNATFILVLEFIDCDPASEGFQMQTCLPHYIKCYSFCKAVYKFRIQQVLRIL
jgi:hypothetical protein